MKFSIRQLLLIISGLSFILLVAFSCNSNEKARQDEKLLEAGKLVGKYCGSCHLSPDPALLDKETWHNRVLPAMARQLGLEVWRGNKYFQNERSAVSLADWLQIVAYFDTLAPQHLPAAKPHTPLINKWSVFSLKIPASYPDETATTTLVAIDSGTSQIYTSDAAHASLYTWDNTLKQSAVTKLPSPAVQINLEKPGSALLTCIGEIKAQDVPAGSILEFDLKDKFKTIASELIRPVYSEKADLNKDGLTDYVVSSFGHNKGGLYWIKQLSDKTFRTIPIREVAGATKSVVQDFNQDGWPDIMALFAHGDEGIWLFLNDQKGGFTTKNMLRFPPVYGSSSFELADMNQDGLTDIVYTAGDNSDYSRILKPYHGLYIFTNTGNLAYKQTYFYPINGCTRAMTADFDQDGDLDIATIAFFADFKGKPAESFIYFEHSNPASESGMRFNPYSVPVSSQGRWICMDVRDYDQDGDKDIVLGNYSKGFINQEQFKPNWNVRVPFAVLNNNTK